MLHLHLFSENKSSSVKSKSEKEKGKLSVSPGLQIRVRTRKLFSYFTTKTYVVGTQKNRVIETYLLSTQNKCFN